MGLDISAYSRLVKLDNDEDACCHIHQNYDFPGRCDDVAEGAYSYDACIGFRAGSYSHYNKWREQLADLVGTTPQAVWKDPKPGPFVELINFSDAEGTLGTETCSKLAKDFADFETQAALVDDEWFVKLYAQWRRAFEMASNGGAVAFH